MLKEVLFCWIILREAHPNFKDGESPHSSPDELLRCEVKVVVAKNSLKHIMG